MHHILSFFIHSFGIICSLCDELSMWWVSRAAKYYVEHYLFDFLRLFIHYALLPWVPCPSSKSTNKQTPEGVHDLFVDGLTRKMLTDSRDKPHTNTHTVGVGSDSIHTTTYYTSKSTTDFTTTTHERVQVVMMIPSILHYSTRVILFSVIVRSIHSSS